MGWKDKGRYVRKGEKAIVLCMPVWNAERGAEPIPERSAQRIFKAADQEPEHQLQELRRYVQARGWTAAEYVDKGVSGASDSRPALDRLGRNLKHLVTLLDELRVLGVAFVSLAEGGDATTPAGKLQMLSSWRSRNLSGSESASGCWRGCSERGDRASGSAGRGWRCRLTNCGGLRVCRWTWRQVDSACRGSTVKHGAGRLARVTPNRSRRDVRLLFPDAARFLRNDPV